MREEGHDNRCPLYTPLKATHYCSICGEGIYAGEEYVKNDDGDYRHYDCFHNLTTIRELLDWLGYQIKIMEDDDD